MEAPVSVAATIAPRDAAARLWDCAIVGAGPAGAMAARELARRNASVLLVEKSRFPRYKVCGGCFNSRSLRLLRSVGLGQLLDEIGATPLTRVRLAVRRSSADVPMPTGAAASREVFDAALVKSAIAAGVQFLPATSASIRPVADARWRQLRLRHDSTESSADCRVVLAANGLAGSLDEPPPDVNDTECGRAWTAGSRIGAGTIADDCSSYDPSTVHMACGAQGYVGLVRIEGGRLDVAAALDPQAARRSGGPGELAASIIAEAGLPEVTGLSNRPWKGTPHLTRSAPRLAGERLFVLGDAAGYIEPFTGEGIAWAFSSATLVAPLAMRALERWEPAHARRWRAIYRRRVTPRQIACRVASALLRRPWLTHLMVRALSIMPWLLWPLLQIMYRD
jgi:flavin-dependent dehydrogenase